MKINQFDSEMWLTEHELDYTYNLTESCIQSMTLLDLCNICDIDLMNDLSHIELSYGDITGNQILKEEILKLYKTGNTSNITITHGGINANELILTELLDSSDHIISFSPSYQQLYDLPKSFGCEVSIIELKEENNWDIDLIEIEKNIKGNTKAIVLNTPNNPTGTQVSISKMNDLVSLCKQYDLYIVADEIYRGLGKDGFDYPSFSDLYDKAIISSGISKVLRVPGLRIGWIKGNKEFIDLINYRRDYAIISAGPINEYLALNALQNKDKILKTSNEICDNGKMVLKEWLLQEPLVDAVIPELGTTCFLHYHLDIKSKELCERLQQDTGVMFIPGSSYNCEYHLRFGFTHSVKELKEGLNAFSKWLDQFR